jgi:hypothetical protein
MGTNFRHFKALSKKNWINWKRTPVGNIVELCTPFSICMLLYFASLKMVINTNSNINLQGLNHGLYPAFS